MHPYVPLLHLRCCSNFSHYCDSLAEERNSEAEPIWYN